MIFPNLRVVVRDDGHRGPDRDDKFMGFAIDGQGWCRLGGSRRGQGRDQHPAEKHCDENRTKPSCDHGILLPLCQRRMPFANVRRGGWDNDRGSMSARLAPLNG